MSSVPAVTANDPQKIAALRQRILSNHDILMGAGVVESPINEDKLHSSSLPKLLKVQAQQEEMLRRIRQEPAA